MGKQSKKAVHKHAQKLKVDPSAAILNDGRERLRVHLNRYGFEKPRKKIDPFLVSSALLCMSRIDSHLF